MPIDFDNIPGLSRQALVGLKKLFMGLDTRMAALENTRALVIHVNDTAEPTGLFVVVPFAGQIADAWAVNNATLVEGATTVTARKADVAVTGFSITFDGDEAAGTMRRSTGIAKGQEFAPGDVIEVVVDMGSVGTFDGTVTLLFRATT